MYQILHNYLNQLSKEEKIELLVKLYEGGGGCRLFPNL